MRYAMVVLALAIGGQAAAQDARDSALQSTLDSMYVNPLARLACVAASATSDSTFKIDSLVAQTAVTRCEGFRGAVAFIRDTAWVDDANVHFLNKAVLKQQAGRFWIMCGMRRPGEALCDVGAKEDE